MGIIEGGRISYIFILVRDLENMLTYYRDFLGFHVAHQEDGRCAFLELSACSGPQMALYVGRHTSAVTEDNHWFTVIDVDDLDATAARARAMDIRIDGIFDVPYGRAFKLTDPEGNVIQFHQPTRSSAGSR